MNVEIIKTKKGTEVGFGSAPFSRRYDKISAASTIHAQ